ncbi:MAG: hypothetical protein WCO58_03335 [bacterium]
MLQLSFLHKKNKPRNTQLTTIFWWKVFIIGLFAFLVLIISISYGIFSKADQDPFVADTTNTIGGVKQYNSDKVQKIKQYFDDKAVIYNSTVTTKLQIKDPSI